MKMTDFVVKEAILPELQATTKESAIRALVESLRKCGTHPRRRRAKHRRGDLEA